MTNKYRAVMRVSWLIVLIGAISITSAVKSLAQTPLRLYQPLYNCTTGAITFFGTGGDGTPITYSAPGVIRSSPTSDTGVVEQVLRNDPKPITITATQSGYTTSVTFDLKTYCIVPASLPPVLTSPIQDLTVTTGTNLSSYYVSNHFRDPNPHHGISFYPLSFEATNTPPGLYFNDATDSGTGLGNAYFTGTPTKSGVYIVTVTAYFWGYITKNIATSDTFTITVVDPVTKPTAEGTLALTQPTYNCATGAITFNTSGGNGSPITYSAPGITRSSASSNTGIVEQGLRNDPKPITIQATQSGYTTSYTFDLISACSNPFKPPVLVKAIPNMRYTVGQTLKQEDFYLSNYIVDPTQSQPHYFPEWTASIKGLPAGISQSTFGDLRYNLSVSLAGAPTVSGVYTVTATAATQYFVSQLVMTTFTITVVDESVVNPPTGGTLALTQPTYNCATGAITFNTTGGDGSPITYSAPGITRSSASSNTGVVEQGLRNDPKPITIQATQSGYTTSYTFDLKAYCTPRQRSPLYTVVADRSLEVGKVVYYPPFEIGQGYYSPSDPNNYKKWSFSATGLPPGLSVETEVLMSTFFFVRIGGTPTTVGVYPVTVTAIDPQYPNDPSTTRFTITVVNASTGGTLALTQPIYDCASGAIIFKTTGGDGSPIEFRAIGITDWTTNPNQFVDRESRTANDVQPFTLLARQSGRVVVYSWDLKAACGRARVGATESGQAFSIQLLGNPVQDQVKIQIQGAEGQSVQLRLTDLQGRLLESRTIEQAKSVEEQQFWLQASAPKVLLLQAATPQRAQTVKIIKQ